jgi:hypothetical protein
MAQIFYLFPSPRKKGGGIDDCVAILGRQFYSPPPANRGRIKVGVPKDRFVVALIGFDHY